MNNIEIVIGLPLLLQVGLEIELPHPRELLPALRFVPPWAAAQYPVVLLLASWMGFGWAESLLERRAIERTSYPSGKRTRSD